MEDKEIVEFCERVIKDREDKMEEITHQLRNCHAAHLDRLNAEYEKAYNDWRKARDLAYGLS